MKTFLLALLASVALSASTVNPPANAVYVNVDPSGFCTSNTYSTPPVDEVNIINGNWWKCTNQAWTFYQNIGPTIFNQAIVLPLSVANGGTGTATPTLTAGSNVTLVGTWPNYTISAAGGGGGGGGGTWGSITGTLANQTDLNTALNALQPLLTLPLSVGQGGNGTNSPALTAGAGITLSGAWPNYTIASTGTSTAWGAITGTLSSQADLVTALAAKQNTLTLPLSIANGGTGVTSAPTITAGSNVTVSGAFPAWTIASSGGGGGGSSSIQSLTDYSPTGPIVGGQTSITFNGGAPIGLNGAKYTFGSAMGFSLTGSATDVVYIWVDNTGRRNLGFNSANTYTLSNFENATPVATTSTYPGGTHPIEYCNITTGHITACTSDLGLTNMNLLASGYGVDLRTAATGLNLDSVWHTNGQGVTNYTFVQGDNHKYVPYTGSSASTWGLPQPTTPGSGNFADGWNVVTCSQGTGANTITPLSSTINGATSLAVPAASCYWIQSDGTNYHALPWGASGGGGGSFNGGTITTDLTIAVPATTGYSTISVKNDSGYGLQMGVGGSTVGAPLTNTVYFYDNHLAASRALITGQTWEFLANTTPKFDTAPLYTLTTPASSSATCTAGALWADTNFVYVCTATNTIKRSALATF